VRRVLEIFLGILTAFGGFVDMGDLVANAESGARFGMRLAWVVVVGVVGICIYAEMAGRVATMSRRPVFDIIRERLGARWAIVNLGASFLINLLTLAAEVAGLALVIELVTGLNYILWVPMMAVAVWLVLWKVKFGVMEKAFGLSGLTLVVMVFALWRLDPGFGDTLSAATHIGPPSGEPWTVYAFFGVALLGAAMTPYEVFFFSSGAVEDGWTERDLMTNRANVLVGFPLGGILSLAIMGMAAALLLPRGISVGHLSQMGLPVSLTLGRIGLVFLLFGMFAAIFSAALETSLSAGYTVAQFFGWQWGKFVRPREAARFHVVVLLALVGGVALAFTTIDPVKITEYSIVLSAAALPLTYFPILVVANDPTYMRERTNSKALNAIAFVYLVILLSVSIVTIPLLVWTRGGA
jgi:Mn2+/Fe2+ NRAMP family transporter